MIQQLSDVLRLERPLNGMDLETTGTNKKSARIVELGLEMLHPGREARNWRTLINPGVPIPPSATVVHHITDTLVKDERRFDSLAENLARGFDQADFCGYNVRFDLEILSEEFRRARRPWDYEQARIIDPFRVWQVAEPRSLDDAVSRWLQGKAPVMPRESHTLEEIADALGEGRAHTALWDTRSSTRVLAALLLAFPQLPRDVQRLHDLCWPGWFDAQGKLKWRDGELCFAFGEHRDLSITQVPRDYLNWITRKDFSAKVKEICRNALRGQYPTPPEHCHEDSN